MSTKNVLLIFSLILSILSLIISILSYVGVIRYMKLRFTSCTKITEAYKKLPKFDDHTRVVLCMYSPVANIPRIMPTIRSLFDQTVRVDQIIVVIESGKSKKDVPQSMRDMVSILPSGKDYHNGAAIVPVLLRESNADTTIIAVDTNKIYGKDFVESVLSASAESADCVIETDGAVLVKPSCIQVAALNDECVTDDWLRKYTNNPVKTLSYNDNFSY